MNKIDCTVLIYNYHSRHFLRMVVKRIRLFNDDIKIIIADQSEHDEFLLTQKEFGDSDTKVVHIDALGSGYSIDFILKHYDIKTEYLCTMDVDTIPLRSDWLSTPISKLQEGYSFVGLHAEIEAWYEMHEPFFIMAQCFRVGRTKTFLELSQNAGFIKNEKRHKTDMHFEYKWVGEKHGGYTDDAVIAFYWEDRFTTNNKYSYPVTKILGVTSKEGEYGRVIGDLVMHFCFSFTKSLHGSEKRILNNYGAEYVALSKRIEDDFSDELLEEILSNLKEGNYQPEQIWDGVNKKVL